MNQFKHQHVAHQQNFPHKLQQRRVYHGHFNTEATFATFKVYPHDTALAAPNLDQFYHVPQGSP